MADFLHVKILSPNQIIFDGQVLSVSSKNSAGNFDILPYHANFITLVQNEPILIKTKDQNRSTGQDTENISALERFFRSDVRNLKFQFPLAIIYAANNEVKVYTDIVPKIDEGK